MTVCHRVIRTRGRLEYATPPDSQGGAITGPGKAGSSLSGVGALDALTRPSGQTGLAATEKGDCWSSIQTHLARRTYCRKPAVATRPGDVPAGELKGAANKFRRAGSARPGPKCQGGPRHAGGDDRLVSITCTPVAP
jgi:hypothetical protein